MAATMVRHPRGTRRISIHYQPPISDRQYRMTLTPADSRDTSDDDLRAQFRYTVVKKENRDVRGLAVGRALAMHFNECKRARKLDGFGKHHPPPPALPVPADLRAKQEAADKERDTSLAERRKMGNESHAEWVKSKAGKLREQRAAQRAEVAAEEAAKEKKKQAKDAAANEALHREWVKDKIAQGKVASAARKAQEAELLKRAADAHEERMKAGQHVIEKTLAERRASHEERAHAVPAAWSATLEARGRAKLRALGRSPLQLSPAPKEMIAVLHATRKNNGPIAAKLAREKAAAEGSTSAKRGTYFGTYAKGSKQSAAPGAPAPPPAARAAPARAAPVPAVPEHDGGAPASVGGSLGGMSLDEVEGFDDSMLRNDLGYPLVASLRRAISLERLAALSIDGGASSDVAGQRAPGSAPLGGIVGELPADAAASGYAAEAAAAAARGRASTAPAGMSGDLGAPRGAAGVAAPRALAPLAPPAPSGWDDRTVLINNGRVPVWTTTDPRELRESVAQSSRLVRDYLPLGIAPPEHAVPRLRDARNAGGTDLSGAPPALVAAPSTAALVRALEGARAGAHAELVELDQKRRKAADSAVIVADVIEVLALRNPPAVVVDVLCALCCVAETAGARPSLAVARKVLSPPQLWLRRLAIAEAQPVAGDGAAAAGTPLPPFRCPLAPDATRALAAHVDVCRDETAVRKVAASCVGIARYVRTMYDYSAAFWALFPDAQGAPVMAALSAASPAKSNAPPTPTVAAGDFAPDSYVSPSVGSASRRSTPGMKKAKSPGSLAYSEDEASPVKASRSPAASPGAGSYGDDFDDETPSKLKKPSAADDDYGDDFDN